MLQGEIWIATTWAASTSFIPFHNSMRNALDVHNAGVANRAYFATTAYVHGVWERQIFEGDFKSYISSNPSPNSQDLTLQLGGIGGDMVSHGSSFRPGTVIACSVRKIKALKKSPNRSGVQVNRQLLKGNRLIVRYLAKGELVRP